jgi:dephospho-CoA kinase
LIVIGAVGRIGSGKDTVVRYISKKCSIPIVSIGDIAREMAEKEGLPATRENLQVLTEKCYERFGRTYFIEETMRRMRRANRDRVLITGIRAPTDVTTLKERFRDDFVLICVVADRRRRFRRLLSRGEPRDPKTWQEFLEQDRAEERIFQLSVTCKLADYRIENDGTMGELFQRADVVIEERLGGC